MHKPTNKEQQNTKKIHKYIIQKIQNTRSTNIQQIQNALTQIHNAKIRKSTKTKIISIQNTKYRNRKYNIQNTKMHKRRYKIHKPKNKK